MIARSWLALAAIVACACADEPAEGIEPASHGPWLEDVTESAGIVWGVSPIEGFETLADRFAGGVCVLDADGVGPLDLFFAARRASRLFTAASPWEYRDATNELIPGAASLDAIGCLAFDADGDDDDDLLVTGRGTLRLFRRAAGGLQDVTNAVLPPVAEDILFTSAAALDLEPDGDVDLFVGAALHVPLGVSPDRCGDIVCSSIVSAHAAAPNAILVRRADGTYADETATISPEAARAEPTLVVAASQLDGRDRLDVYVGNDLGLAFFDRALIGIGPARYRDFARDLGIATNARGNGIDTMGWSGGDVDGDGVLDHVVSSSEGDATALFLCSAEGYCEERGAPRGMLDESYRWGVALVDLDLDGDLDLVEAVGHWSSPEERSALPNVLENDGSGAFTPRAGAIAADGPGWVGRGLAIADLDDDGRPDVVLGVASGSPAILRNVATTRGRSLRLSLRARSASGALGARVEVARPNGRVLVRERRAGEGYLGSFDPRIHVGLGDATEATVTVRWPSGAVSRVRARGPALTIEEPSP